MRAKPSPQTMSLLAQVIKEMGSAPMLFFYAYEGFWMQNQLLTIEQRLILLRLLQLQGQGKESAYICAVIKISAEHVDTNPECLTVLCDELSKLRGIIGQATDPQEILCYANAIKQSFEAEGNIMNLTIAISAMQTALSLIKTYNPNVPDLWVYHSTLGDLFRKRSERLKETKDIEESLLHHAQAVEIIHPSNPDYPGVLHQQSLACLASYRVTCNIDDLQECLRTLQRGFGLQPVRPVFSFHLGIVFRLLYEYDGRFSNLENAIHYSKLSLDLRLKDPRDPEIISCRNTLGNAVIARYKDKGDICDLRDGISHLQEAVNLVHPRTPAAAGYLTNLGDALMRKYQDFGDEEDLLSSTMHLSRALLLTRPGDIEEASRMGYLGWALMGQYRQSNDIKTLNQALDYFKQALDLSLSLSLDALPMHRSLGSSLFERFNHLQEMQDLHDAIVHLKLALELAGPTQPSRSRCLWFIGRALFQRSLKLGNSDDLRDAIINMEDAIKLTPEDNPQYSDLLKELAKMNLSKGLHTVNFQDRWTNAISALSKAAHSTTSPARSRFTAAEFWASLLRLQGGICSAEAMEVYTIAVHLIPRLAYTGIHVKSRYSILMNTSNLVSEAVETALGNNKPYLALEWLEQGRSVIWNQLIRMRTSLDDLRKVRPDLANKIEVVASALDHCSNLSIDLSAASIMGSHNSEARLELSIQYENLVERARKIAGFQRFLLPKEYNDLKNASIHSPVIVLNVTSHHCSALILASPSQLHHIDLRVDSSFLILIHSTLHDVLNNRGLRRSELVRAFGPSFLWTTGGISNDDAFKDLLALLWIYVVKPCIHVLQTELDGKFQHIRWCPTGPLMFLPIHAAGVYDSKGNSIESLLDIAVSSYIPSLSSLLHISDSKRDMPLKKDFKMLAISLAQTLPGAQREVKLLQHCASESGHSVTCLRDSEASIQNVLDKIGDYGWIHFACHGVQDGKEPLSSGLELANGRLRLSELMQMKLPHADFAFLSACQTATGNKEQPEESVHLAAGMLSAGFRSVIATMWDIPDSDAPIVAERVYKTLLSDQHPDSSKAAAALHGAVNELRQKHITSGKPRFASWVPFIHVGL